MTVVGESISSSRELEDTYCTTQIIPRRLKSAARDYGVSLVAFLKWHWILSRGSQIEDLMPECFQ